MTQIDNWEERFDEQFKSEEEIWGGGVNYRLNDDIKEYQLKDFIQEQITLAKEQERKRILEEIWREMANTKNLPARAGIVDLYELQKIINKIK